MKDAKIFDGAAWQSLRGPSGPAGPSVVSADAGNALELGSDGLVYGLAGLTDSNAYILCKHGDTPQARYDLAKTLTPNGQPLSATNRATLIVLPGTYAGSLAVDTSFVDVYGVGQQPNLPAVTLGGISVTAADVRVSGISVGAQRFAITGLAGQHFTNCTGGNQSFGGGPGGIASGTFINCTGTAQSFGGGGGTASGTFTNCIGGAVSFGLFASGTFTNCTTTGSGSFSAVTGAASGTFINCTGRNTAFGGGGGGVCSGTFINCTADLNSFNGASYVNITAGARLIGCRLTVGSFGSVVAGAVMRYCIDGNFNEVNTP